MLCLNPAELAGGEEWFEPLVTKASYYPVVSGDRLRFVKRGGVMRAVAANGLTVP
jgi:hypothetical protein